MRYKVDLSFIIFKINVCIKFFFFNEVYIILCVFIFYKFKYKFGIYIFNIGRIVYWCFICFILLVFILISSYFGILLFSYVYFKVIFDIIWMIFVKVFVEIVSFY